MRIVELLGGVEHVGPGLGPGTIYRAGRSLGFQRGADSTSVVNSADSLEGLRWFDGRSKASADGG